MYRLYFKPDEEVSKAADQDDDEDLLTDDDKGNNADGDRKMRDANPARNPRGVIRRLSGTAIRVP
jgi:hypothetical protein